MRPSASDVAGFRARIKQVRKAQALTIDALAALMGVSKLLHFEMGKWNYFSTNSQPPETGGNLEHLDGLSLRGSKITSEARHSRHRKRRRRLAPDNQIGSPHDRGFRAGSLRKHQHSAGLPGGNCQKKRIAQSNRKDSSSRVVRGTTRSPPARLRSAAPSAPCAGRVRG